MNRNATARIWRPDGWLDGPLPQFDTRAGKAGADVGIRMTLLPVRYLPTPCKRCLRRCPRTAASTSISPRLDGYWPAIAFAV